MQELPGLVPFKVAPQGNELRVQPELSRFSEIIAAGRPRYVPVYCEVVVDAETPVTAFVKLTDGQQRFLLESVDRGEQVGRYSFIGWEPLLTVKAYGDQVMVTDAAGRCLIKEAPDPLAQVRAELEALQVALLPELGKFYGGAVGYLGYDY
ncbi:MAG TPA: hypothetical protein VEC37_02015, partial [Bacillota bacterium]|nr:hypothetical protein [Bacillota bacterium]